MEDAEAAPRRVSRHRLVSLFGDADERGVRVCALGQRVTGESLEPELRAETAYFVGTALLEGWLRSVDLATAPITRTARIRGARNTPRRPSPGTTSPSSARTRGRTERAAAEFEAPLADRRRVLGDDHPKTDNTRRASAEPQEQDITLRTAPR
ncbi:hypothetical protein ACIRA2_24570 [Streptomyces griseoviridis]